VKRTQTHHFPAFADEIDVLRNNIYYIIRLLDAIDYSVLDSHLLKNHP